MKEITSCFKNQCRKILYTKSIKRESWAFNNKYKLWKYINNIKIHTRLKSWRIRGKLTGYKYKNKIWNKQFNNSKINYQHKEKKTKIFCNISNILIIPTIRYREKWRACKLMSKQWNRIIFIWTLSLKRK